MPARSPRRWTLVAACAVLPWSWFALRNLGGRLETVAVLLPPVVVLGLVLLVVVALARRERALLAAAASLAVFGLVATLSPRLPHRGPPPVVPLTLVSANVFLGNPTPDAAVTALLATEADVEVAVETGPDLIEDLESRDIEHPYAAVDDQLVVRSRYPLTAMPDPPNVPAHRILRATVDGPAGPFVLYAVHALNPLSESTFADQLTWVDRLLAAVSRESLPVVMAGDFNMSDRQLGYRRLVGELRDAITASGWGRTTYAGGIWGPLFLRIDHVFVPQEWCAAGGRTVELPGSDHDGVAVQIGPCS